MKAPLRIAAAAAILAAATLLPACATSRSTPPPAAELPRFSFAGLRGTAVSVTVLDQRPGTREAAWTERITGDLEKALGAAGVAVRSDAPAVVEVRLLKARSDFEDRQWNGCVELSARLVGAAKEASSASDACVTKSNLWGKATADNVLRLAYSDALVKLLSALDAQL